MKINKLLRILSFTNMCLCLCVLSFSDSKGETIMYSALSVVHLIIYIIVSKKNK
jgi:hypothetical protein